jgi:hypothetical protein
LNWAFELLGLRPDAEAADVKRAYARLLRTTRPDEDAQAFQRLHAAYKLALAHANTQASASASTIEPNSEPAPLCDIVPSSPKASSVPAPSTLARAPAPAARQDNLFSAQAATFDPGTLANEVIREALTSQERETLVKWLECRPEFWSISVKQQVGRLVLQKLFQQPQAMFSGHLDALLHFFDFDHVLSGINPVALQELRTKQTTLWELLPENHRELARRMRLQWGNYPDTATLRKHIALLQQPFSWSRTLRAAMTSGRARSLAHLVHTLLGKHGRLDELPPSIDRHHAHFWLHAGTTATMTPQRFALGSLVTCVAALAFSFLAALLIGILQSASMRQDEGPWYLVITGAGIAAAGVFATWLLYAGSVSFDYWQGLPETTPSRKPWLRRLAIPLLCVMAFLLEAADASFFVTMPIALAILIVTARRVGRRAGVRPIPAQTVCIILLVITANMFLHLQECKNFHLDALTLLISMGLWASDIWRHRAQIHPKLARN